jgi:hypothetical protein
MNQELGNEMEVRKDGEGPKFGYPLIWDRLQLLQIVVHLNSHILQLTKKIESYFNTTKIFENRLILTLT